MLIEGEWAPDGLYDSDSEFKPIRFFSEGLINSSEFDLFLGFFSSSAIQVLSAAFAVFLGKGGKMRLIVNIFISPEDQEALKGKNSRYYLDDLLEIYNFKKLEKTLSKRDIHFFKCLSWLIANNRIEVKIITPKEGKGIAHVKKGIFSDGINNIAFEGSCNFSKSGLIYNKESLNTSWDWDGDVLKNRVNDYKRKFNEVFSESNEGYRYISAQDLNEALRNSFPDVNIIELIKEENELLAEDGTIPLEIIQQLKSAREKLLELRIKECLKNKKSKPFFPFESGPRPYQKIAFENWKNNGQQGLFAMATGTGKTITALNCLLEISNRTNGVYKALILVNSKILGKQWENECYKFGFYNVISFFEQQNIEDKILEITRKERLGIQNLSYIIICSYQSFIKQKKFKILNNLSRSQCLLIADEMHNLGSQQCKALLDKISLLRRIGLSATPERPWDEETDKKKLLEFFNCQENFTFEFSTKKAIEERYLCSYQYYPKFVELTEEEWEEYIIISKQITKLNQAIKNAKKEKENENNKKLESLRMKRKNLINKASNKYNQFQQIIKDIYINDSLLYCFVFVPEGYDSERVHFIDKYTNFISQLDPKVLVCKILGGTPNRARKLEDFASGKINVLTSMKCLNEGVDVPRADTAILCASTQNPREYIQRRGRILRQHDKKSIASIYDLVVLPPDSCETPYMQYGESLLKSEFLRVAEFGKLATNKIEVMEIVQKFITPYNICFSDIGLI